MLLDKYVYVKWNGANKKHYINMGYKFTKIGDELKIHIIDASKGCNSEVMVECDYCGNITKKALFHYFKETTKPPYKDCCSDKMCTGEKAKDAVMTKYGVKCTQLLPDIKNKTIITMNERYGYDNHMQSDEYKEKFKALQYEKYGMYFVQTKTFLNKTNQTMNKRYGCDWYTQTDEYKVKSVNTCLKKYGVEYFLQSDKIQQMRTGENNPNWKGGFEHHSDKRNTPEYKLWRTCVFIRDDYTCQCCNQKGKRLNAHHIHNYATNEDMRFDEANGITLCECCHKEFHHLYGYLNTNEYQLKEFLSTYGKNIV